MGSAQPCWEQQSSDGSALGARSSKHSDQLRHVGCRLLIFTLSLERADAHSYIHTLGALRYRSNPLTCIVACRDAYKQSRTHTYWPRPGSEFGNEYTSVCWTGLLCNEYNSCLLQSDCFATSIIVR